MAKLKSTMMNASKPMSKLPASETLPLELMSPVMSTEAMPKNEMLAWLTRRSKSPSLTVIVALSWAVNTNRSMLPLMAIWK